MGIEEVNKRPSWHVIYMTMAFQLCSRSLDPRTKHGCFVVAEDYSPLSFGFNSPPQGCDDAKIPLSSPEKYPFFAHAEQNAIDNAAGHGIPLKGSIFYITGFPCPRCFQSIRRVKAKRVIYGPVGSVMITQKDLDAVDLMNTDKQGNKIVELVPFESLVLEDRWANPGDDAKAALALIKDAQDITWDYINKKCLSG